MFRVMIYCVVSCVATSSLILCGMVLQFSPLVTCVLCATVTPIVVVPFALYDTAKLTHEMIGPFARVHGMIRRLIHGDVVPEMEVREPMWREWIADFNIFVTRVQSGALANPSAIPRRSESHTVAADRCEGSA